MEIVLTTIGVINIVTSGLAMGMVGAAWFLRQNKIAKVGMLFAVLGLFLQGIEILLGIDMDVYPLWSLTDIGLGIIANVVIIGFIHTFFLKKKKR